MANFSPVLPFVADAKLQQQQQHQDNIVTVTFQPREWLGITFLPLGLEVAWNRGRVVTGVDPDGQAYTNCVQIGWVVEKVNDSDATLQLFDAAIAGTDEYRITFFTQAIFLDQIAARPETATAVAIPGCVDEKASQAIQAFSSHSLSQKSSFDPRVDSVYSSENPKKMNKKLWLEGFFLLIMAGIDNVLAYVTFFTVRAFHGSLYNIVDLHFTLLSGVEVALLSFAVLGTLTFVMMIVLVECLKLPLFHELMNIRLLFSALPTGIICGILLYHSERTEWAPFATVVSVLCTIFTWCLHMRVSYTNSLNVLSKISLDVSWFLASICVTILAILYILDELKIITNSETLNCPYAANERMPVFAVPLARWYCAPWDEEEPSYLTRQPINSVPVTLTCSDTFISTFGMSIEPHLITCPSGCLRIKGFDVVGCGVYAIDSPVCVAAIHAGELTDAGGQTTVYGRLGVSFFQRCSRNSVISLERYVTQTGSSVTIPQAPSNRRLVTVPAVFGPNGQQIPQAFHFNNDQPASLPQTREYIWLKKYEEVPSVDSGIQADKPWTKIQATMSLRIAGIELSDEKVTLGEFPVQPLFVQTIPGQVYDVPPAECHISESGVVCGGVSSAVVQLDFCRTEVKQCL